MISKTNEIRNIVINIFRERNFRSICLSAWNRVFRSNSEYKSRFLLEDWLKYYKDKSIIENNRQKDHDLNGFPKISILILTYNNLIINQICLTSILCNTTYPNFEIIVIDNASTDSTPKWLREFTQKHSNVKIVLNSKNIGFAAGNNQAAQVATGEYLIFLNNDTVVTKGWVERLLAHLQDDLTIGLIGPVTNSTGNEARVPVDYQYPSQMEKYAAMRSMIMSGKRFDIRMLAFYCVMARKSEFESLGGLDERFGLGMFEDDDLAVRYKRHQLKVVCAEDVFIHHFQGASFKKLKNRHYEQLFKENKNKYEEKWNRFWIPYEFREDPFLKIKRKKNHHICEAQDRH